MRRAFLTTVAMCVIFMPVHADAASQTVHLGVGGAPSPSQVTINGGGSVTWKNDDPSTTAHRIFIDGGDISGPIASGGSFSQTFPDPGDTDATVTYHVDSANGTPGTVVVKAAATTTTTSTTQPASSTTSSSSATTTSNSTTTSTSTSSTTTTSSSTTSTTTTTLFSSGSGQVAIADKGGRSGGSSALPLLLGAAVVVAGLAGLAYWLWWRSGEPYDDGPDWTQEPPPTVQGPRI